MQLEWFTVIAQIVNFLVLVWLLKHFLYGRIVRAMDAREAQIAAQIEAANRKRAEADREAEQFRAKNRELNDEREKLLVEARTEAESRRQQLVDEARANVASMQADWLQEMHREKLELLQGVREQLAQQVLDVARQTLKKLANAQLERQMLFAFLEHLRRLDSQERQAMTEAIRVSDWEVELRSAFPLDPDLREPALKELREILGGDFAVRFEVEPDLGCGIELRAHSHRMVWNLESYLDALEQNVFRSLDERANNGGPERSEPTATHDRNAAKGPR